MSHHEPAPLTGPLIACVDSSEDIVQLLADSLCLDGFRVVTHATPLRRGSEPVIQFIAGLRPDACIYTIGLPYAASWAKFQALRGAVPDVPFVLTTLNRRGLEGAVGPVDSIELLGKSFDLDEIARAVRRALVTRADGLLTRP